jgi:hypothetical protein
VADFKAEPDLLRHLDPSSLAAALAKVESEMATPARGPWPTRLAAVLAHLEHRQQDVRPSALWLAWMRVVHPARVEALAREPVAPQKEPPPPSPTAQAPSPREGHRP